MSAYFTIKVFLLISTCCKNVGKLNLEISHFVQGTEIAIILNHERIYWKLHKIFVNDSCCYFVDYNQKDFYAQFNTNLL